MAYGLSDTVQTTKNMKTLITILCLLPLIAGAQFDGKGVFHADTVRNAVIELQPNEIYFHYAHSDLTFKDSAVTITGGDTVQITNAYDSLYQVNEADNITYVSGDTMQIDVHGSYLAVVQRENTVSGGGDSFTLPMPDLYSYFEQKAENAINISLNDACITYMHATDYSDWTLTEN